jgi:hypothetical protein
MTSSWLLTECASLLLHPHAFIRHLCSRMSSRRPTKVFRSMSRRQISHFPKLIPPLSYPPAVELLHALHSLHPLQLRMHLGR